MELKKWLAIGTVGIAATAALLLKAQGPATAPTAPTAATTAPTTQMVAKVPATKPSAVLSAPNNDNGNSGNSRRNNSNGYGSNNNNNNNNNNGYGSNRRSRNNNGYGNNRGDTSLVSSGDPFSVLQTRSIFIKGVQTLSQNTPRQYVPTGPLVGKRESSLVFNGVIITNGEPNALVENLDSNDVSVSRVRTGDAIAGGKVASISLEDLVYSANGRTVHVAIGQNLEGNFATFAPSTPAPSTLAPVAAPAVTPGQPPVDASQPPVSAPPGSTTIVPGQTSQDDVVARLKARRAAENAGK